ncbi:hypothetical protein PTSG_11381, partial [Salpingoeca rosetta]
MIHHTFVVAVVGDTHPTRTLCQPNRPHRPSRQTTTGQQCFACSTTAAMEIDPVLWVLMAAIVIGNIVVTFVGARKGWFHWEHCTQHAIGHTTGPHPGILLFTRLVSFLFAATVLIMILVDTPEGQGFKFYTIWNFTLLVVFFFLALSQSIRAALRGYLLSEVAHVSFFDRATFVLFQVCMTMAILVDVVLWTVLYPTAKNKSDESCCEQFINFFSIVVHGINLVLMLVELGLNRMVFVHAHATFIVYWLIAYGVFEWAYVASTGDDPVYFFLDTSKKIAPAWYAGMFALHVVFFYIAFGLTYLKRKCCGIQERQNAEYSYLLSTTESVA